MNPSWKKILLAAVIASLLLLPAASAGDWPQWRGPNRESVCSEKGLLESFPAAGLKVRWRAPVGWGFSSPVVAQGRVYLADSEAVKPKAKERLHCFDEATGKPLWTFQTSQSLRASPMTYMFDNRQLVAIASGTSVLVFGLTD